MTIQPQDPTKAPRPTPRPGTPAAADAIWNWRRSGSGPRDKPGDAAGHARREGAIRGLVGAIIGTLIFFFWHRNLAWIVWSIAGVTFLAALLSPTLVYRWIQTAVNHLALWIGTALSWVLLPLLFFLFLLPLGLLTRRGKSDRLERWFDGSLPSYWKKRNDPERGASYYERQF